MSKMSRIILLLGILIGTVLISYADRGINKKSRSKVSLNINTNNSFKNSLSYNLNNGLKYKGSLISTTERVNSGYITRNLITYQKGNSIYIIPTKQKVIISDIGHGYSGVKLIIRHK